MRLLAEQFLFDLEPGQAWPPRFNIAPTQPVAALRVSGESAARSLTALRWGLIPSWAKDAAIGNRMINARGETVAEKPSFRNALKRRRCLVLSDGYYEWQKQEAKAPKQPFFIGLQQEQAFALAGLWETWKDPAGGTIASCTIITTAANDLTRPIHDRMPVILHPTDYDRWLDPDLHDAADLQPLLIPFPSAAMKTYPVSTLVNNPRNEDPACTVPLA